MWSPRMPRPKKQSTKFKENHISLTQKVEDFIKNAETVADADFRKMVAELMRLFHNHVSDTPIETPAPAPVEPAPAVPVGTPPAV